MGTAAALAELLFSDQVAKLEVVLAFTYKTNPNIHPHCIVSKETSCLCLA